MRRPGGFDPVPQIGVPSAGIRQQGRPGRGRPLDHCFKQVAIRRYRSGVMLLIAK